MVFDTLLSRTRLGERMKEASIFEIVEFPSQVRLLSLT